MVFATIEKVTADSDRDARFMAGTAAFAASPKQPAATAATSAFVRTTSAASRSPVASVTALARPDEMLIS